jgi:hypothetical protein
MDANRTNIEGGPAFPVSIPGCGDNGWSGMTVRDYFAAQAMQGLLADGGLVRAIGEGKGPEGVRNVTRIAYAVAESMLLERERK